MKEEEVLNVGFALFLIFFYLIMFHEPQTWSPMVVKKMCVIYFMYIGFI